MHQLPLTTPPVREFCGRLQVAQSVVATRDCQADM